jgi:sugar/nucleoside kinase (ribokinase family)
MEKRMDARKYWMTTSPAPIVVGSGLIALDVMVNERRQGEPRLWTGGTCGNVLAILAYLGWHAIPVARLGRKDPGARLVFRDLRHWDVDLRFASLAPTAAAPVIIHRLRQTPAGISFHSFSVHCPDCGRRLPPFSPITNSAVTEVLSDIPHPAIVFVDRVSRGILTLTQGLADGGSLVVFEPISIGDESLFREMLSLAHVLKYSHERLAELDPAWTAKIPLQIETLGEGGVRYKSRLTNSRTRNWRRIDAFAVPRIVDSAGAGDWCTGGILHVIGCRGVKGLKQISDLALVSAINFGQALAAWNCRFEGARGGMYESDLSTLRKEVDEIIQGKTNEDVLPEETESLSRRVITQVCSECRQKAKKPVAHRLLHVS